MNYQYKFSLLNNIIKSRYFSKRFPLMVSWSLTNRCNTRCRYCGVPDSSSGELSTQEIILMTRELKALGTKMISFSGGEPLLRKDIGEILSFCYANGIVTSVYSNGILVPDRIHDIRKIGRLKLSLDGDRRINDFLRGKGSYDKVMEAVRVAIAYKINVSLNCVLTKYNLDCVDFLISKAKRFGVLVRFQPVSSVPTSGKDVNSLLPELNQYKEAIKKIIMKKIKLENIENSLSSLSYIYRWPNSPPLRHCVAGKIYCRISSLGKIFPCPSMEANCASLNDINVGVKDKFSKLIEYDQEIKKCKCCFYAGTLDLNMLYNLHLEPFSILKTLRKF